MRVAITGGSGQLGTLVLRRLADDRAVKEIVAIDLRSPLIVSGKIRNVSADIRGPLPFEGCDAVIHLAFLVAKRGNRELQDDVNVRGFLQGLVTNDVAGELPVWAGLLTPQGKCLFDFIIWGDGDDLLFDCEAAAADDLIKRLSIYRLRRPIRIAGRKRVTLSPSWSFSS